MALGGLLPWVGRSKWVRIGLHARERAVGLGMGAGCGGVDVSGAVVAACGKCPICIEWQDVVDDSLILQIYL